MCLILGEKIPFSGQELDESDMRNVPGYLLGTLATATLTNYLTSLAS